MFGVGVVALPLAILWFLDFLILYSQYREYCGFGCRFHGLNTTCLRLELAFGMGWVLVLQPLLVF